MVNSGVLSQAELALSAILFDHQVTHMVQLQGAATGGQDTVGPVAVAPFLVESFADVRLRGGAIEAYLLAEVSLAATKTPSAAAATTAATPTAGVAAPLEEASP